MDRISKRDRGFTLVELMVTLAVLAILLVIAVPGFRNLIQRNRVSAASNALLADLHYARAEAINRGQLVSLCPSSDGGSCSANANAWESGWLVYTYPAGAASANRAYATGNIKLRATDVRAGVVIRSGSAGVVSFGEQGQLQPSTSQSFVVCARDSGVGISTAAVPGAVLSMSGSGSLASHKMSAGDTCVPG